jgi:hypothetical protein
VTRKPRGASAAADARPAKPPPTTRTEGRGLWAED